MEIETTRLILRNYQKEDLQDYFELVSGKNVGPRAGWPPYIKIEDAKDRLEDIEMEKPLQFAIVLKEKNKVIGSIELMDVKETRYSGIDIPEDAKEIGYILNENYWGKGYMTESLQAIKEFAFEKLGISMIVICHAEANIGSGRVQEKNGFRIVGNIPNYRTWVDGKPTSLIQRLMTKEEYESIKRR